MNTPLSKLNPKKKLSKDTRKEKDTKKEKAFGLYTGIPGWILVEVL